MKIDQYLKSVFIKIFDNVTKGFGYKYQIIQQHKLFIIWIF